MSSARMLGSALGVGAVVALLLVGRPQPEAARLGAGVSVQVASGGAIAAIVPGGGPLLADDSLRPGDPPLKGRLLLVNRAPTPVRVSLKAVAPGGHHLAPKLAAALRFRVGTGAESGAGYIDEGPASFRPIEVPAGARRQFGVSLGLDPTALAGDSLAGEHLSLILTPQRQVLE